MATGELLRPGVEVIQTIRATSPSFTRPTLVPCVVGPAFEVINVLNSDATINDKSRYGLYAQIGKAIAQSAFPAPRGNGDELDVIEDTVRLYMLAGGVLSNLPLKNGSSFLATSHVAQRAGIKTKVFGGQAGIDLNGKVLVLAIDQPSRLDLTQDVTVVFVGSGGSNTGTVTAASAAAQINAQVGQDVASVVFDDVGNTATDRVLIASNLYGALSSVTVRAGGSANGLLEVGWASNVSAEERVVGSGYRGQDDNNLDTITPWIEFFQGDYVLDGKGTGDAGGPAWPASRACLLAKDEAGNVVTHTGKSDAITFTGPSATIPLKVGDFMMADGVRLRDGEVMKVEQSRFKVGVINKTLSVADASGEYTTKVYDVQQVGTLFDGDAFAPEYVYFVANDLDWRATAAQAASLTGSGVTPTLATAATVTGQNVTDSEIALAGLRLHYVVTIDGEETEGTFTFTGGPFIDDDPLGDTAIDKIAAAIGESIPGVTAASTTPGVALGQLKFVTAKQGRKQKFVLRMDGTANAALGFSTSADTEDTGSDVEYTGLAQKYLTFQFDKNPFPWTVMAPSNSLDELIDEINATVGFVVASKDAVASKFLVLTSPLKGAASEVEVVYSATDNASGVLGLTTGTSNARAAGSGRPLPDAYTDDANVVHVGAELLRDQVKGFPLRQDIDNGYLFIQYKALRKDVSPSAKIPGVLKISDIETLQQVLDPITEENPLGLGLYLCMLNAPTFEVKGLGIDEVTPAAMEGTGPAWARAANALEAEEVYAIAPLTQDETIQSMWMTHCSVMSSPEQGGERIVFPNKKMPTRRNSRVALSGSSANSTSQSNQLILDSNPSNGLVGLGLNPGNPFSVEDGVFVELVVDDQLRRYNVAGTTGSLVNLNTTFAAGENVDGFYSDVKLDVPVVSTAYSLKVRGLPLVIPGSNPERLDYQTLAETVSEANQLFKNRRVYEVFPDTVTVPVQGVDRALPGYYASAAIVGMVGAQPPQQGFTNFPLTGVTGVKGTEKFTKRQLNIMAGGGTYILMQEVVGGSVFCRHQVSTDLSSVETRELSITKVVDFTAKFLRTGVRRFIGTNNINSQLLDTLGTTVHAILAFLEETGVLNGFNVNNLVQDKDNPDTVLIDVTLDVPYPCNYIRLTLVV